MPGSTSLNDLTVFMNFCIARMTQLVGNEPFSVHLDALAPYPLHPLAPPLHPRLRSQCAVVAQFRLHFHLCLLSPVHSQLLRFDARLLMLCHL